MSDDKYQYLPIQITDYLIPYFAVKLKSEFYEKDGKIIISLNRNTSIGASLLKNIETSRRTTLLKRNDVCYLKVSNFAGNNYSKTMPQGKRFFLTLKASVANDLNDLLKLDFEEALFSFVQGAEFSHRYNGWHPDQKKKGITKAAVVQFCSKYNMSPDQRRIDSLLKQIFRLKKAGKPSFNRGFEKFAQSLSF